VNEILDGNDSIYLILTEIPESQIESLKDDPARLVKCDLAVFMYENDLE